MASAYRPWAPSTGPGYYNGNMPQFSMFQMYGYGIFPGSGYRSNLGPNNTPYPGPPSPPTDMGILLEPSLNEFIALEVGNGGPAAHLILE